MFTTQDAIKTDLERANMVEPRPELECEPWHFSQEYRDVALRHVWTLNRASEARQIAERGLPRRV